MVREFKLPDVGEGVAEGELVEWLVAEGDAVSEDQPVAEVETDKALVEVPSPVDGTVRELRAEAGDVIPVGDVFITFDVADEGAESAARQAESGPVAGEEGEGAAGEPGTADDEGTAAPSAEGAEAEATDAAADAAEAGGTPPGRTFAAPSVRRLARELGVDLGSVSGSGPGGRVTEGDVRAAAEGEPAGAEAEAGPAPEGAGDVDETGAVGEGDAGEPPATATRAAPESAAARDRTLAAPATRRLAAELGVDLDAVPASEQRDGEAFVDADAVRAFAEAGGEAAGAPEAAEAPPGRRVPPGAEERVPYRGLRRTIGQQMERSLYTAPHVTHHDLLDAKSLVEARRRLQPRAEERGIRLSYLPFVMRALTAALPEFPTLNAELDEEAGEIVLKGYCNLGFAAATDDGLLVPVVHDAGSKGLLQLASEVNELAEKARDRSIALEEMQGGTFTITNFGAIGGEYGTPIINHPEVAILGLGSIEQRPYVVDGEVVARETMPISLSFDHRVIDGATAGRFTNRLVEYLEDPLLLLLD